MAEFLTQEGLDKLKKEVEKMKTDGRKEVAEKLKQAIAFGDLSENAAYDAAKEAQAFLESEIARLEHITKTAKIIEVGQSDEVQVGSSVTIKKEGEDAKYQIVSPTETSPLEGKISYNSPLGVAMIGKRVGEEFEFETPSKKFKCKILKIE